MVALVDRERVETRSSRSFDERIRTVDLPNKRSSIGSEYFSRLPALPCSAGWSPWVLEASAVPEKIFSPYQQNLCGPKSAS